MLMPPLVMKLGFRTKNEMRDMPQTEPTYEQFEDMEDGGNNADEEKNVHVTERIDDLHRTG